MLELMDDLPKKQTYLFHMEKLLFANYYPERYELRLTYDDYLVILSDVDKQNFIHCFEYRTGLIFHSGMDVHPTRRKK